jgi:hypothetical protein
MHAAQVGQNSFSETAKNSETTEKVDLYAAQKN